MYMSKIKKKSIRITKQKQLTYIIHAEIRYDKDGNYVHVYLRNDYGNYFFPFVSRNFTKIRDAGFEPFFISVFSTFW